MRLEEDVPAQVVEPEPPPAAPVDVATVTPDELRKATAIRSEEAEIQRTLGQYKQAYDRLNARAAREVWPSVDERALARAFEGLSSQELDFETCQFDVGPTTATASCRGRASYIRRVGSKTPQTAQRFWTFRLRKLGSAWKIDSVQIGS
jgi:hypothetical protein